MIICDEAETDSGVGVRVGTTLQSLALRTHLLSACTLLGKEKLQGRNTCSLDKSTEQTSVIKKAVGEKWPGIGKETAPEPTLKQTRRRKIQKGHLP